MPQLLLLIGSEGNYWLLIGVFHLCEPEEGGRLLWLSVLVLLLIILFGFLFLFPVNHHRISLLPRFLLFIWHSVDKLEHLLGLLSLGPPDFPDGL